MTSYVSDIPTKESAIQEAKLFLLEILREDDLILDLSQSLVYEKKGSISLAGYYIIKQLSNSLKKTKQLAWKITYYPNLGRVFYCRTGFRNSLFSFAYLKQCSVTEFLESKYVHSAVKKRVLFNLDLFKDK